MGRECDGLIAQITESFEVNLTDLIRKLTTDCSRLIRTVGINDDPILRIAPARQVGDSRQARILGSSLYAMT